MYSRDFNPNLNEYFYYARNITKEVIPPLLIELSFKYYEQLEEVPNDTPSKSKESVDSGNHVYQCQNCMTIYDYNYGDSNANIAPGVSFEDLPSDYTCSLCGAGKENFQPIDN